MLREEGKRKIAGHGWEDAEGAVPAVAVASTAAEAMAGTGVSRPIHPLLLPRHLHLPARAEHNLF